MDAVNNGFTPRAEFWLCLAQALLPPRGEFLSRTLRDDLADDLAYLADSLGLDIGDNVAELRAALAQTDAETLLPAYSSLFLVPPIPARLNASFYLDGTLLGANTRMLAEVFQRHGVEQSPDMHDTPDHLATILEFLALLFQKKADGVEPEVLEPILDDREAVRGLLRRVLPEIATRVAETERERELPTVYSVLLGVAETALRDGQSIFFAAANDEEKSARRYFTKRETAVDMVACKQCGKPVATARELKVIIDRLRQSGLPSDHLELCPDCRDSTRGWEAGKTDFNLPGFR